MIGSYWHSPTGQHVLQLEQLLLADHIRRFHGDTVVWAGSHPEAAACLQRCMVRNPVFMSLAEQSLDAVAEDAPEVADASCLDEEASPLNVCVGDLLDLPFKSASVDGFLLHHGLEFAADPRTALREVTRVLAPGGRLILVGFNPFSLFGARRLYSRFVHDSLSVHALINPLRLLDWLALLGYELQDKPLYTGHGLPFVGLSEKMDLHAAGDAVPLQWKKPGGWIKSKTLPPRNPFGGVLILNAIKQSAAGNMQWQTPVSGRRMAPVTYPRVSTWRTNLRVKADPDINVGDS